MTFRRCINEISDECKTLAMVARNRGLHTGKSAAGWQARHAEKLDGLNLFEAAIAGVGAFNVADRRAQAHYDANPHQLDDPWYRTASRVDVQTPAWLAASLLGLALENIDQRQRQAQWITSGGQGAYDEIPF